MSAHLIFLLLYGAFGIACIFSDIRRKKIPNSLNMTALLVLLYYCQFFLHAIDWETLGIWWGISFALWFLQILGGGDAKMLMWLGIGVRASELVPSLIGITLLGTTYIGISLLASGRASSIIMNIKNVLLRRETTTHKVIFSPPLVIAMLIQKIFDWKQILKFIWAN